MFNFSNNRTTARQSINRLIEKSKNSHRGFTLVELLLVVAIMGMMGTLSVGGYRAMRRGMEERGVMQNAQQFINLAYERAMIEGKPTVVYFWNETRQDEKNNDGMLVVVGHAVAVRQSGRISSISSTENCLMDEFGDLRFFAGTDKKAKTDDTVAKNLAKNSGTTMNLYRMKPGESLTANRFPVAPTTVPDHDSIAMMLTDPGWNPADKEVKRYGYRIKEGVGGKNVNDWKADGGHTGGMPYGTEFSEITLPNNYIFGSSFKTGTADPIAEVNQAIWFYPPSTPPDEQKSGGAKKISIWAIRPGSDGSPSAHYIGETEDPARLLK